MILVILTDNESYEAGVYDVALAETREDARELAQLFRTWQTNAQGFARAWPRLHDDDAESEALSRGCSFCGAEANRQCLDGGSEPMEKVHRVRRLRAIEGLSFAAFRHTDEFIADWKAWKAANPPPFELPQFGFRGDDLDRWGVTLVELPTWAPASSLPLPEPKGWEHL